MWLSNDLTVIQVLMWQQKMLCESPWIDPGTRRSLPRPQVVPYRLSKISWFVSGGQINYLPKRKAEANNWSTRHWQITIFCIIQSPSLFSYFNHFLEAQGSNLPFFFQECSSNYLWAEYYLHLKTFRRYYISLKALYQIVYWPSLFGQDGWILASFFFLEFMDLDSVLVHKQAKNKLGQYPAILTLHLVDKPYMLYATETGAASRPVNWLPLFFKMNEQKNKQRNKWLFTDFQ